MSESGILDRQSWLWCHDDCQTPNQVACFRRTLNLTRLPDRATLFIGADARYWLYVNGVRVGYGPARYPVERPFVDQRDLLPHLRRGDNVIAVRVHGIGKVNRCSSFMPVRCALLACLTLRCGDREECVPSDRNWRAWRCSAYADTTPRHSNHQGFVECFDARAMPAGWTEPGFDDASWRPAVELGPVGSLPPWQSTRLRPIPFLVMRPRLPVRVIESGRLLFAPGADLSDMKALAANLAAARRLPGVQPMDLDWPMVLEPGTDGESAYVLLDFAENASGYITLRCHGKPGTVVDFGYSESIRGDRLETNKQGVRYCDRLILSDQPTTYHPAWPKTMQYLLLAVRGRAVIESVHQDVSHYPLATAGRFACSDMTLERIWQVGLNTVKLAAEDVYMDTPRRERAGWLADLRPQALVGYTACGDRSLIRHQLRLIVESQNHDGVYVDYRPDPRGWVISRWPSIDGSRMPDFTGALPQIMLDYVQHTGDREELQRHWPRLLRLMDHVLAWTDADGLIRFPGYCHNSNDYLLVDWAPFDRRGANTALNMIVVGTLTAMVTLAEELGESAPAQRFAAAQSALQGSIRQRLFDPDRGVYVNGWHDGRRLSRYGYQENLLALLYGIATSTQEAAIQKALLDGRGALPVLNVDEEYDDYVSIRDGVLIPWDDTQPVPIGSPYFTFFAVWALMKAGRMPMAMATLREQYGPSLRGGASTTWERWNGSTSQSHGWGAGPTWLLLRYVLGVQPVGCDGQTLTVLPSFGDLASASGRVATRRGVVQVAWRRASGASEMQVLLPNGPDTTVGLPCEDSAAVMRANGREVAATPRQTSHGRYLTVTLPAGDWLVTCTGAKG